MSNRSLTKEQSIGLKIFSQESSTVVNSSASAEKSKAKQRNQASSNLIKVKMAT